VVTAVVATDGSSSGSGSGSGSRDDGDGNDTLVVMNMLLVW
jgi:hypothetical protein